MKEIKKTEQSWKVVEKEIKNGVKRFELIKGSEKLVVDGKSEFVNIMPIVNGIGAVAVEQRTKKTITINWFVVNENGKVVHNCNRLQPNRFNDVKDDEMYIVDELGVYTVIHKDGSTSRLIYEFFRTISEV